MFVWYGFLYFVFDVYNKNLLNVVFIVFLQWLLFVFLSKEISFNESDQRNRLDMLYVQVFMQLLCKKVILSLFIVNKCISVGYWLVSFQWEVLVLRDFYWDFFIVG